MKLIKSSQDGFTLIEVLIVFTVLTLLFSFAMTSFSTIERSDKLKAATAEITSTLSLAQSQTINGLSLGGAEPLQFGVFFETDKFTFLPENIVTDLPQGIIITTINLPENKIIFTRVTGQVENFDPLRNYLILNEGRTGQEKKIIINKLGVADIE